MPARQDSPSRPPVSGGIRWLRALWRVVFGLLGLILGAGISGALVLGLGLAVAWPNLFRGRCTVG